jgi:UDP:flavonoid glycosyltransferase YjiC (YdhE family)
MNVLFVSLPALGHMDLGGCVRVARCLREQGHRVAWGTGYPLEGYVRKLGFEFYPVAPHRDVVFLAEQSRSLDGRQRAAFAIEKFFLESESLKIGMQELLQACDAFAPDVVCTEPFHFCLSSVAELVNVPWVTYGSNELPLHYDPKTWALWDAGIERLNQIRAGWRLTALPYEHASLSPYLRLSFSCPAFELEPSSFNHSIPVGVPLLETIPDRSSERPPYAVVTLGSVFRDGILLERIVDAVLSIGWQVVISQGAHQSLPLNLTNRDGVLVLEHIDHAEWFPQAELVICHGGYSTTKDALTVGVPLLVIPLGSDNPINAERVKKTGAGITLARSDASTSAICAALLQIKLDPSFRERATSMQREFARYGGAGRASALILGVAGERTATQNSSCPERRD